MLVALAAALVELPVAVIVAAVFATWVAIAVVEVALARGRARRAPAGDRFPADAGDATARRPVESEQELAAPR